MPAERQIHDDSCGRSDVRHDDRWIAAIAGARHGVIGRAQLLRGALTAREIDHRVATGKLHVIHAGVYSVGHPLLSQEGRWMAAVLAAGEEGVLSHRSAGAVWGICADDPVATETTSPGRHDRRAGLRPHRGTPADDETTLHRGIPVTTIDRTLIDLAAVLPFHRLARAVDQAEILGVLDLRSLTRLMLRHRGRRGIARLRLVLAQLAETGARMTRSELEDRFLHFLDVAGIRKPETNLNVEIDGRWFEVDCFWREERVIVELDGYAVHGNRSAFETDRERLRILQAAGFDAVAVTWRQISRGADALERDLRRLLQRRASDPRQ